MTQRANHRLRTLLAVSTVALSAAYVQAQVVPAEQQPPDSAFAMPLPFDRGAAGLAQSLRKLSTRASLLQINAHPDDEDGATLAYESRGAGAEVSLLSLNRGEGGQNVMTSDFWDALGILRTQEHLAANRYYGVHLYYTRVADFGFSKTREETLKQWGHERVLADAVRVVRETRPMVITSVFSGNVSDGHGHHQTAGVMAQEVFTAAADPKMFPEQLKEGLRPWAPLKVYARAPFARASGKTVYDYATGKTEPLLYRNYVTGASMDHVPEATVTVHAGTYNPLFGQSYAQVAREGLNQQKSQNGGVPVPLPGSVDASYHLYATRVNGGVAPEKEATFFDGIDTSLPGIASYLPAAAQADVKQKLEAIAASVTEASARFDGNNPALSAPALARGLDQTRALLAQLKAASLPEDARYNATFELATKQHQFETALAQSLGMSLVASVQGGGGIRRAQEGPGGGGSQPTTQSVIAGESFGVTVHVTDQGTAPVTVDSIKLIAADGKDWKTTAVTTTDGVSAGASKDYVQQATVPVNAALTAPYYSRPGLEQSYYDIHSMKDLTLPTVPYPLQAVAEYTFNGTHATLAGVVQTPHRYNGIGTVYEPLLVAPAISVTVSPASGILPLSDTVLPLQVTVHSSVKGMADGTLKLQLPQGWSAEPASAAFHTMRADEDAVLKFRVHTPGLQQKMYRITAVAQYNGKDYTEGFTTIGYPGVRPYPRYAPSTSRITGVNMKIAPSLHVGYVMGSGDEVPDSLREMGIEPVLLTDADLQRGDLSGYDCIVLGVRTYTARPVLRSANNRLLDYVHNGGTVIVQYQSGEFDHDYGPYPISVPGDQAHTVVEEDAKVTILHADDPLMTWPNHIDAADFDNWVEERGHGFTRSFAPEYKALTEVHDTDQDPQQGGLLYARYGKGTYVYLAYAFFREMPEGVPGSFRIMANLLSVGKNPRLTH